MTSIAMFVGWVMGSCISAEFLGYWLHRLMHSGARCFARSGNYGWRKTDGCGAGFCRRSAEGLDCSARELST